MSAVKMGKLALLNRRLDEWKNRSFSFPVLMNPYPFSVNLLMLPSAMRRMLLKYHLHKDQDLFDRAYGYIRQYY